jgi:HEAT repeat protein
MKTPGLHILLPLLLASCLGGEGQVFGAQPSLPAADAGPDSTMDTQLRINKTTLLETKSDKVRIDTASLLLLSENASARDFVLEVLRRTDNPPARAAICEALNQVRIGQKVLKKEDFIKPLIAILTSEEDPLIAKPAADATLIFGYSQVQAELEKAVADPALSVNVRTNIIYAIKRHPDKQAVTELINLLESRETPIAEAARSALLSVGIPVTQDSVSWQQVLADLKERGPDAYLRDRVIRDETRLRELERDLTAAQAQYLTALGGWYDALADDTAKNTFLAQRLSSSDVMVRAWTLDKLQELRKGKGNLKLSELEPILLGLISDPSRQVRLKTARLLALMGELNTSKALLDQLKIERDEQVMREILVALGETCYAGSMPTAGRKISDEVRKETLDWAAKFLGAADADKARSGAAVIGKLLEQDGLKPEEVGRYLKALADRYTQVVVGTDPVLRGDLLGTMAGLCTTRSTCKEQAVKLYSGIFEQALADKAEAVRLRAVDGCVNVDKMSALRKLRENMAADPSVAIRQKLMDLAGESGGSQDLDWLAEKLGVTGEGELAWRAMLKIFRRSDLKVLSDWAVKIEVLATAGKIGFEQRIAFLTLVEQMAQSENKADVLKGVRTNLAQLYVSSNSFKQAGDYLKMLLAVAATEEEKQRVQAQLLRVYLGLGSMDQASDLISKCLSSKDLGLGSDGFLVRSIEEYLNSPTTTDPVPLLRSLEQIRIPDPETSRAWRTLVGRWSERYAKAKSIQGGAEPNN